MRNFKEDAFAEIPLTIAWLKEQPCFSEVTLGLSSGELYLLMRFENVCAEMAWRRESLSYMAETDEALLIAVKKVVQGVLKGVIMGL